MKVTDEFFHGVSDLIEQAIKDGMNLAVVGQIRDDTAKGLAHNATVQICQNLEAEPDDEE